MVKHFLTLTLVVLQGTPKPPKSPTRPRRTGPKTGQGMLLGIHSGPVQVGVKMSNFRKFWSELQKTLFLAKI